jgi:integral membrane protein
VFQNPVGRVRAVGMVEAVSFILLMFVAMPIKYLSPYPDEGKTAVFWVGLVHGILFISYAVVAFAAWFGRHIRGSTLIACAVASVLPFGPFVIDRKLKTVESAERDAAEVRG